MTPFRSSRRSIAHILTIVSIPVLAVVRPADAQPTGEADVARFAETLNETGPAENRTGYARAWSALDSLVLRRLNAGVRPEALGGVLAGLPGYSAASAGEGVRVGSTAFYSQLPREAPSYLAAPLALGRDTVVLGVYSLTHDSPGRLSLYHRRGGRWRQAGRYDAGGPLEAYLLPLGDTVRAVVAFERFVGADRWELHPRLLRLTPSALRVVREEPGRMVDPDVDASEREVAVAWDSFPRWIMGAVLGPRLRFRTTYRVANGRVAADTVSLKPWMEAVDDFYRNLDAGRTRRARALVASDEAYRALVRLDGSRSAADEDGDLARGEGWVGLDRGARRVSVRRGADGRWRVVSVQPVPGPEAR